MRTRGIPTVEERCPSCIYDREIPPDSLRSLHTIVLALAVLTAMGATGCDSQGAAARRRRQQQQSRYIMKRFETVINSVREIGLGRERICSSVENAESEALRAETVLPASTPMQRIFFEHLWKA